MNRLRVVRAERRISQFRLRLETGIHQSKISLFENDLIQPTEDEKQRLAKALRIDIVELFGDGKPTAVPKDKSQGENADD
jgi:transcriptional regulator with XRE-family HTH domain